MRFRVDIDFRGDYADEDIHEMIEDLKISIERGAESIYASATVENIECLDDRSA